MYPPSVPCSARAAVPHVRAAELPQDDGQPGPVPAQVQPGAAVGSDRGVSVLAAQQESAAPQEVHQDCSAVSGRRRARATNTCGGTVLSTGFVSLSAAAGSSRT